MEMLLMQPQTSYNYGVALINAPMTLERQCSNNALRNLVEEMNDNGDPFGSVDDLLDFSRIDDDPGEVCNGTEKAATAGDMAFSSTLSSLLSPCQCNSTKQSILLGTQLSDVIESTELSIPREDIAQLEWLSNFVEESFSSNEGSNGWVGQHPQSGFPAEGAWKGDKTTEIRKTQDGDVDRHQESNLTAVSSHLGDCKTSVECTTCSHGSPPTFGGINSEITTGRKRRSMSIVCSAPICFWNTQILSIEASECLIETSTTHVSPPLNPTQSQGIFYDDDHDEDDRDVDPYDLLLEKVEQSARRKKRTLQPAKLHLNSVYGRSYGVRFIREQVKDEQISRKKKDAQYPKQKQRSICAEEATRSGEYSDEGGASEVITVGIRRCLHCGSDKTPQWRAGPRGPKTLCNACGVRYKSGRLFPEYRPAASPTFVESLHSNSHRRVLEMRKQQGMDMACSVDPVVASHIPPSKLSLDALQGPSITIE